jgi:glycosyltransferase involved in cell wall biosynthesis
MFQGRTVAVVVPAFNEADKIEATIRSLPGFVDHVIVVDDASSDGTGVAALRAAPAVDLLMHRRNQGVGAAIASGYQRAIELNVQAVAVMAGDGQMDPGDLPRLLAPVAGGAADYAKGNRLAWPGAWAQIPAIRLGGGLALSWLTRLATGYRVLDSQCGYTVISRAALLAVGPHKIYPRYGYPNDLLARLAEVGARVVDVPVRPVYGPDWRSGLRPARVAAPIARILARAAWRRLVRGVRPASPPPLEQAACASAS